MNYKDSGVDIEAGNAFVERLKEKAPAIGGFGGAFKVPSGYEKPVLISGADGVLGAVAEINRVPIAGAAVTSALLVALPTGAVSLPPLKKSATPKAIARRSRSFLDI